MCSVDTLLDYRTSLVRDKANRLRRRTPVLLLFELAREMSLGSYCYGYTENEVFTSVFSLRPFERHRQSHDRCCCIECDHRGKSADEEKKTPACATDALSQRLKMLVERQRASLTAQRCQTSDERG